MVPARGEPTMTNTEWMALLVMIGIMVLVVVLNGHHGDPPGYWGY